MVDIGCFLLPSFKHQQEHHMPSSVDSWAYIGRQWYHSLYQFHLRLNDRCFLFLDSVGVKKKCRLSKIKQKRVMREEERRRRRNFEDVHFHHKTQRTRQLWIQNKCFSSFNCHKTFYQLSVLIDETIQHNRIE